MKSTLAFLTLTAVLAPVSTVKLIAADETDVTVAADLTVEATDFSPGSLKATPQMWFYLQEKQRYDDPQQARRRRAEGVAQERRSRIASAKWMGFSKSRPKVNHPYYPWDSWRLYAYGWARYGFPTFVVLQTQVESPIN